MIAWFKYFTVFLKNRNFISKIRISKVTDYAALSTRTSLLFFEMILHDFEQIEV